MQLDKISINENFYETAQIKIELKKSGNSNGFFKFEITEI